MLVLAEDQGVRIVTRRQRRSNRAIRPTWRTSTTPVSTSCAKALEQIGLKPIV
jgi:hypothetical protein